MQNSQFEINDFLKKAVAYGASDIHLTVGEPPILRKNGLIARVNTSILKLEDFPNILKTIISKKNYEVINTVKDFDFVYELKNISRFRVNYCLSIENPQLNFRIIPYEIPTIKALELPNTISNLKNYKNGIVFVTGPTGSGKSTTLAALIEEINQQFAKHIITIEDPIEFYYKSKKCIITQRNVGSDTNSFRDGLKFALRQDPDVILVGEIRDKETMDIALKAAETGHLVFATLHTNDAIQSINRIINLFDESNRDVVRKQVAESLRATVAQQLVYSQEHKKRFPACEIMLVTSTIKDYILKEDYDEIYQLISQNTVEGMTSMNQSLELLVELGKISQEEAINASTAPEELSKVFRGYYK